MLETEGFDWLIIMLDGRAMTQVLLVPWYK